MTSRKHRIELTQAPSSGRVVVSVPRARGRVSIDLFANAALRWLCRGHAPSILRVVAIVRA